MGDEHRLVGIGDLGRLGHEMNAGEDDDLGGGFAGKPGELQRVSAYVGDSVKYVGCHVIVRQNDRIARCLQLFDLGDKRLEESGFDVGHQAVESEADRGGMEIRSHGPFFCST